MDPSQQEYHDTVKSLREANVKFRATRSGIYAERKSVVPPLPPIRPAEEVGIKSLAHAQSLLKHGELAINE